MKIKKGQIDNEVAYYRVVEQNMIRQDNNKMTRFKEHEAPLDEEFVFKKYDINKELASRTMIGWIELRQRRINSKKRVKDKSPLKSYQTV